MRLLEPKDITRVAYLLNLMVKRIQALLVIQHLPKMRQRLARQPMVAKMVALRSMRTTSMRCLKKSCVTRPTLKKTERTTMILTKLMLLEQRLKATLKR